MVYYIKENEYDPKTRPKCACGKLADLLLSMSKIRHELLNVFLKSVGAKKVSRFQWMCYNCEQYAALNQGELRKEFNLTAVFLKSMMAKNI